MLVHQSWTNEVTFSYFFTFNAGGAEELLGRLEERAILIEDENLGLCEAVCQEYLDFVYWQVDDKINEGELLHTKNNTMLSDKRTKCLLGFIYIISYNTVT